MENIVISLSGCSVILLTLTIITKLPTIAADDPCLDKRTCHDCIQTAGCNWCLQPDINERCFYESSKQCPPHYIVDLKSSLGVITNRSLTTKVVRDEYSSIGTGQESIVQVQPQRIHLDLRINDPVSISVRYRQAVDHPVDLYYLMDLSNSMKDDKDELSRLGDSLIRTMRNITSNFNLGFGSFVDKVAMPYVSTVPKNLKEPCSGCTAPYGFHNVMNISQNAHTFSEEVRRANVSGNLDGPEGGFDAIMQAIVCGNIIGWREKARKLLVFSTDAPFHYAGDGKLGGIVKPNDGCCHLSREGIYTHSNLLDYPSVSQLNLKVKENSINVIFAVTAEQVDLYRSLGEHIEGSSCGKLSEDSGNVVDLVVEEYNKITSSIEMKDTASLSIFNVTYFSRCMNPNNPLIQTNKCDNLKVGQIVEFQVKISAISCPADPKDWKQQFNIYPVGHSESLAIDVRLLCECPCESPNNPGYIENSPNCSFHGTMKCGVCSCDKKYYGPSCNCSTESKTDDTSGCRPDKKTTIDCSGHGRCECNRCICDKVNNRSIYWGTYCQCNLDSCDRYDNLVCSGHGTCLCNRTCLCNEGWTGNACQCPTSTDRCRVGNNSICFNNGVCDCGVCKCYPRYTGLFCEKCPGCPGKCPDLKECVMCKVYKTGPYNAEQCRTNCTFFKLHIIEEFKEEETRSQNYCTYRDERQCRFRYTYEYDQNKDLIVYAAKNLECPAPPQILGVVFGLIGAIVLIGLALLLLWKLLTTIHDRREFAKFEKERMMAKWDTVGNPIYKQATSTFLNPTYCQK